MLELFQRTDVLGFEVVIVPVIEIGAVGPVADLDRDDVAVIVGVHVSESVGTLQGVVGDVLESVSDEGIAEYLDPAKTGVFNSDVSHFLEAVLVRQAYTPVLPDGMDADDSLEGKGDDSYCFLFDGEDIPDGQVPDCGLGFRGPLQGGKEVFRYLVHR